MRKRFRLRADLELIPWDAAEDGSPRLLVKDPLKRGYDLVGWPECEMLPALGRGATAAELAGAVAAATTLRPDAKDALRYAAGLARRGWLAGPEYWNAEEPPKASWYGLFSRLLYFRVPLWNPDAFLDRTLPTARLLVIPAARVLLILVATMGLYLWLPRAEEYLTAAWGLARWRNVAWIAVATALVKFAHELAHAYAAKAGGAPVPAMGLAFVVLFPLPFVDVTEAWRLPRRARLRVAGAGLIAELAVAACALLLWSLSPPGAGRTLFLMLSSTALVSTLATNLNPGMRFDGYFLLTNLIGVENLRARAIGHLTRWWRSAFWGIASPDPERAMSGGRRLGLLFYAIYSWLYRLTVFFGIALLVYRTLPKALGIAMFAIEAWAFVLRPALVETWSLWRLRRKMGWRTVLTLLLVAVFAYWAVAERPRRYSFRALAYKGGVGFLMASHSGEVEKAPVREGTRVAAGELLLDVGSHDVRAEWVRAQWRKREAAVLNRRARVSEAHRGDFLSSQARYMTAESAFRAWSQRSDAGSLVAPGDGRVVAWERWLRPGAFIRRGEILGWQQLDEGRPYVVGMAPAADAETLDPSSPARFYPDDGSLPIEGRVERLGQDRLETLDDGELAQLYGGKADGTAWRLPETMARVCVRLESPPPRNSQSGRVWLETRPRSLVREAWGWLSTLAVRESGF